MRKSNVIIDLFALPSQPIDASKPNSEQSVSNKPNESKTVAAKVEDPAAHSPLIPPASVNASIKQLDKEPMKGQIIIR